MKTVTVNTSTAYPVVIGNGLMSELGSYVAKHKKNSKIAIISDDNVWNIYGKTVTDSLQINGFHTVHFTFPAGEASKSIDTYSQILNFLAENQLTRSDSIVALGGGVTGDMAGFAAATYLRGIDYIQVPTSLLAMVDSSVGGKTAIDLPVGKNLVGAFKQPILVLCDVKALCTLPDTVFRDGCAEVIKYGILYDPSLFAHLEENGLNFDREYVISRCVELKRDVVVKDEFDNGERQKLNLGHTIGHSVEASSNFTISHGQAVAVGTAIITNAACKYNLCNSVDAQRIQSVLQKFSLPVRTERTANELLQYALSDKKRSGRTVNLIVPKKIGICEIRPTPVSELQSFIEAGL